MEMTEWFKMTPQERINESGSEPPCPFCRHNRVMRSDYTRCNHCGINWLHEEMGIPNYLNRDPRVARAEAAHMANPIKPTAAQRGEPADA